MSDLQYTNGEEFENKDFSETPLPLGEYEECTFRSCNFSGGDLSRSRFIDCEFIDCNLSNATVSGTSFQEVVFQNCKMLGLAFEKCNDFGFAVRFERCQLDHASFYQMKLRRTSFDNCQLQEVDFTETELTESTVRHCDLRNAIFEQSNLEKADFRDSVNYSIDPEINRVKGAKFSIPDVIGLLDKYQLDIDTTP